MDKEGVTVPLLANDPVVPHTPDGVRPLPCEFVHRIMLKST